MEEVTQESGSQTVESQQQENPVADAFAAFGLSTPQEEKPAEGEQSAQEEAPAIEQPEPKTIKVKHNKEEVEVDISSDEKLTDHLQRSLALDKERERKTELERNLDRAAKLAGFTNHADYIANLDALEQRQSQNQQNEFEQIRSQLIAEFEDAGGDPRNLEAWLDSNPLLTRAKEVIAQESQRREQDQQAEQTRQWESRWSALYEAYPHLVEESKAFDRGDTPSFYNAEMQSRIERGYDPIDAFELAHKGTLTAQTKKAAEQKAIKDQMLGKRSQVETVPTPTNEPEVPEALKSAFSAFGLSPSAAKKYVKKGQ